MNATEKTQLV